MTDAFYFKNNYTQTFQFLIINIYTQTIFLFDNGTSVLECCSNI